MYTSNPYLSCGHPQFYSNKMLVTKCIEYHWLNGASPLWHGPPVGKPMS